MIILLLVIIAAAGYVADAQGVVASCAISLVALTAIRLGWQYRRRRAALRFRAEIAHASAVLASYLRVGQVPSAALAIAAADCQVLREGHQAHTLGGDVVRRRITRVARRRLRVPARRLRVATLVGAHGLLP